MKTDALIDHLSETLTPMSGSAMLRILAIGIGGGLLVSVLAMWMWLGIRPDLIPAMATSAYWMKFFYTLLFAAAGLWVLARLARPGATARMPMMLEALPFIAIAIYAAARLASAPGDARMHLMMGSSSNVCPWRIAILALPVFAGAFWSLRRLAPTRPVVAGIAAGLAAGAAGAFIYAFHCDESAAPFVAIWYTFGIALVGALGGLIGRFALRW